MQRARLEELNMRTREEVIYFLKQLWNSEQTNCPICGNELTLLHKKAKKSNCNWQCKNCDKRFDTISLMNEMNDKMP